MIVDITVMTIGAAGLITLAQSGAPRRFLLRAVPQFLGRISYSLYLVHAIVLLAILHVVEAVAT